jgi:hypothetical protein
VADGLPHPVLAGERDLRDHCRLPAGHAHGLLRARCRHGAYRQGMVFWQLAINANDPAALARFWARRWEPPP